MQFHKKLFLALNFFAFTIVLFTAPSRLNAQLKYKDIALTEGFICALTVEGELKFFEEQTGKEVNFKTNEGVFYTRISLDHYKRLVVVDSFKNIKRLNFKENECYNIGKSKITPYCILFDSRNNCFAVTAYGIQNAKTGKSYFSSKTLNHQLKLGKYWDKPYCYLVDKHDNIWLGFGYGEWGGDIFIFNTRKQKFIVPELDSFQISLWPIKSFFEDDSFTYLSAGLQHMFIKGSIVKFENFKASFLLNTEDKEEWGEPKGPDSIRMSVWIGGEYIGPAAYNKSNKSIYFYSQNGFFKGQSGIDLSKIENWTNFFKPKLRWEYGQPDAVGSPMNVLKILPIYNEKIWFLTQKNGIGFYNGKELKLID